MDKERERALKLLNKNCEILLKRYAKQYHLKKKLDCLYTEIDGMISILVLYVSEEKEQPRLYMKRFLKPVWLDQLFWDIMDIPQPNYVPLSSHIVGAFNVDGVLMAKEDFAVPDYSAPVMEHLIAAETEKFADDLPLCTEEAYYEKLDAGTTMKHGDMMRVLNAIHRGDIKRARNLLAKRSLTPFSGGTDNFKKQALRWLDKNT